MIIAIEADHANKEKRSGVENACYYLIEALKKIIPAEHRVILYSRNPLQGELAKLPTNWTSRVLPWSLGKGWSQFALSAELRNSPPDVFFAPAQLVPFFSPPKTVVLVHDSAFLSLPEAYGFLSRAYLKWMNKKIVRSADKILVTAKFNQEELQKNYSVSNAKIFVAPLSFDHDVFFPQDEGKIQAIKAKYDIKGKYLLSVGRLEKKKNTALIIKAFDELRNQGMNLNLVLVGSFSKGVLGREAADAFENSKYKSDIKIIYFASLQDLPALYSGAEVFLFPSRYEGFGLPILEAMASGCPVIVADNSAMPDTAGDAALVAKTDDLSDLIVKTGSLLTDLGLREKMIGRGRQRAGKFSWDLSARKIWQVLEQTLPKS